MTTTEETVVLNLSASGNFTNWMRSASAGVRKFDEELKKTQKNDFKSFMMQATQSVQDFTKAQAASEKATKDAKRELDAEQRSNFRIFMMQAKQSVDEYTKAQKEAEKATKKADRERKAAQKTADKEAVSNKKSADSLKKLAEAEALAAAQMKSFNGVARSLNQNLALSNFEAMASIFTQFGGDVSRTSIVLTSVARPLTVVGTLIKTALADMTAATIVATGALAGMLAAITAVVGGFTLYENHLQAIAEKGAEAFNELRDAKDKRIFSVLDQQTLDTLAAYSKHLEEVDFWTAAKAAERTAALAAEAAGWEKLKKSAWEYLSMAWATSRTRMAAQSPIVAMFDPMRESLRATGEAQLFNDSNPSIPKELLEEAKKGNVDAKRMLEFWEKRAADERRSNKATTPYALLKDQYSEFVAESNKGLTEDDMYRLLGLGFDPLAKPPTDPRTPRGPKSPPMGYVDSYDPARAAYAGFYGGSAAMLGSVGGYGSFRSDAYAKTMDFFQGSTSLDQRRAQEEADRRRIEEVQTELLKLAAELEKRVEEGGYKMLQLFAPEQMSALFDVTKWTEASELSLEAANNQLYAATTQLAAADLAEKNAVKLGNDIASLVSAISGVKEIASSTAIIGQQLTAVGAYDKLGVSGKHYKLEDETKTSGGGYSGFGNVASLALEMGGVAGPIGTLIGALLDLVASKGLPKLVGALIGAVVTIFTSLPEQIADLGANLGPALAELIPALVMSMTFLGPEIALALLQALPDIILGLFTGLVNVIPTMLQHTSLMGDMFLSIVDEFAKLPQMLVDAFIDAVTHIQLLGDNGGFLGTGLFANNNNDDNNNNGGSRSSGNSTSGSTSRQAPAGSSRSSRSLSIGTINVTVQDTTQLAERLRREQGSYGRGLSLDLLLTGRT